MAQPKVSDQWKLESTVRDVFSATASFHRTSDQHSAEMVRLVWGTKRYARLTNYSKGYLRGFAACLWNDLYSARQGHAPLLEYVLVGADGRRWRSSKGDDTWLQESAEYKLAFDKNSTHVWGDALDRGEWRPW